MEAPTKINKADTWLDRIAAQQVSGQSVRAWCRDNHCHEHSFYWWRSRLSRQPAAVKPPLSQAQDRRRLTPGPMTFAEVVVSRPAVEPMRLRLLGGQELILPSSMAVEQVAQLLRMVEGLA